MGLEGKINKKSKTSNIRINHARITTHTSSYGFSMKKIIHVDMDCFFAAIEERDNPLLANNPIVVGGRPESRGVVATCNYEARRYGIHSAMPSAQAVKLCPSLTFIKPNIRKYKAVSEKIHSIFHQYTNLVEPISLDEAYLDVTNSKQYHGSATWIAQAICNDIYAATGLTASAGVSNTKFVAKIASDWNKPAGLKVVLPKNSQAFIDQLPIRKLHGVGKVTASKLENLDIFYCHELRQIELSLLIKKFGKFGKSLYELCRGIDLRKVKPNSVRKSLSVETTFQENILLWDDCKIQLLKLVSDLSRRLEKSNHPQKVSKVFIKVKMENFILHSAESISQELNIRLLIELFTTLREKYPKPIRLLGIGVGFTEPNSQQQNKQLNIAF